MKRGSSMKMKKLFAAGALSSATVLPTQSQAQVVSTGYTRPACEAILCLSTAVRLGECAASLTRYFSISPRSLHDATSAHDADPAQ